MVSAAVITSSCTSSAHLAGEFYQKAEAAQASNDLQQAEKCYLNCLAATATGTPTSSYYKLAAVNRLTELENKLHNPSKAKSYMNQAATLAENIKQKGEGQDDETDRTKPVSDQSADIALAKEKHIALMRLADWLFQEGNFISSSKLYDKSLALETELKIAPTDENSAAGRIKTLESSSSFEHDQISSTLSSSSNLSALRGSAADARAKARQKDLDEILAIQKDFQTQGGTELAHKLLDALGKVRNALGNREDTYRTWQKIVSTSLITKGQYNLLAPVIEADMKDFSSFSTADLESAQPEAVENATNFVQDLIVIAQIKQQKSEWQNMLACCTKAQPLAGKLIRADSTEDYELSLLTATALEATGKRAEALPYRKRQLEIFEKVFYDRSIHSDYLASYAFDLVAVNRLAEAEAVARKSYDQKQKLKIKHDLFSFLVSYADLFKREEKFDEARKILLEALPLCQHADNKIQLMECYSILAAVCAKTHKTEALEYNRHIRDILRKNDEFGQNYRVSQSFLESAAIECQLGRRQEAIKTLDEGIKWQISNNDISSAYTAAMYNLKGAALGELGNWKQDKECKLKSIEICRHLNPPQPSPLASSLFQAAHRCLAHKEYELSEKLFREALQVTAAENNSEGKEMNLMCKAALGSCLVLSNKDPADAKRVKTEALSTYKSAFTSQPAFDISLCCCIAELCIALKDKKNATLVLHEADLIKAKEKYPPVYANLERQKKELLSMGD